MYDFQWFWMNFTFIMPFLFGVLMVLAKVRKKKFFLLKILVVTLIFWAWIFLWQFIIESLPDIISNNIFFSHLTFFVHILLMILFIKSSYECDIWTAVFATTVAYSLQHFSHRLFLIICSLIGILLKTSISTETIWMSVYGVLIWTFLTTLIYFLWYSLLFKKANPDSFDKLVNKKIQVIISAIVIVVSIYVNSYIAYHNSVSTIIRILDFVLSCIISFLVILLDYAFVIEKKQQQENERLQNLLKEEKKDYEASKDSLDILNIKLHDIKHLLQTLSTSTSKDTIKDIKESLTQFEQKIKTGNEAIDVIINKKEQECHEKKITFTCFLDARGLEEISPYELYTLFDNAMNNAIQASMNCQEDKRIISIHSKRKEGAIEIAFTNYFSLQDGIRLKDGLPKTKGDKNYHGFGIRSMQMLCSKYHGDLSCEIVEDIFNLYITLPIKKAESSR